MSPLEIVLLLGASSFVCNIVIPLVYSYIQEAIYGLPPPPDY